MWKLKNSRKIISILLLGPIFISIIIPSNFIIVSDNKVYERTPTLISEQTDQTLDNTIDNIPPKSSAPAPDIITNGTFKITRDEDDGWIRLRMDYSISNAQKPIINRDSYALELGGTPYDGQTSPYPSSHRRILLRFNTSIPKNVRITKAYLNLTVRSNASFNGFMTNIAMFYPPVKDFTEDPFLMTMNLHPGTEDRAPMIIRPRTTNYDTITPKPWYVSGDINDTLTSPDLKSKLQYIMNYDSYDGFIGIQIQAVSGSTSGERCNMWAYERAILDGKPEYIPTLYVEWEETPYFVSAPANVIAKNGTRGYHLDWTAADNNPTTFNITCNRTISNIPYAGVWQSGISYFWDFVYKETCSGTTRQIRYDLPPLDTGVYNFTIRINDADGNFELHSVIVYVSDLDLPVIDVKFVQNGKEVDYFQPGNGPFSVRIYNNTSIMPKLKFYASCSALQLHLQVGKFIRGRHIPSPPPTGIIIHRGWAMVDINLQIFTINVENGQIVKHTLNPSYSASLGCYIATPSAGTEYKWWLVIYSQKIEQLSATSKQYSFPVQEIRNGIKNYFEIEVDGGVEYIYNQTIYGGIWTHSIDLLNKDLTPPYFSDPEFIEPEEPDKHYEVNIWAGSEKGGAEIDDVILYYSVDDGPFEESYMVLKDGKYYGEIPSQEEGVTINYYIKITDIAGNSIETDEYHERAPTFEEPSVIIPILGVLLGVLGALSIVVINRHKNKKAPPKKLTADKIAKESKSETKMRNKLIQKIKKVRKKE